MWKFRSLHASMIAACLTAVLAAVGQTAPEPASAHSPVQPKAAHPQQETAPEELGDALMLHQRYQAAIAAYDKAPRSALIWNKTGIAYQMMLDPKDAERCYKASLKMDPKDPRVMNNLATLYDTMKRYGKAEKLYRRALRIDPKFALAYKNLGTNLLSRRKYEKGWEAYQQALALDPDVFHSQSGPQTQDLTPVRERGAMNYYLARSFVSAGQPERAIQHLRKAMAEGFIDARKVAADKNFVSLRGNPAFDALIAEPKQP